MRFQELEYDQRFRGVSGDGLTKLVDIGLAKYTFYWTGAVSEYSPTVIGREFVKLHCSQGLD